MYIYIYIFVRKFNSERKSKVRIPREKSVIRCFFFYFSSTGFDIRLTYAINHNITKLRGIKLITPLLIYLRNLDFKKCYHSYVSINVRETAM